ncbi:hypothetical protein BSL78_11911 [Apostichopus japonicus]|uniref:Integrase catalytic domain-containing protein n=1 Tax=Stichopus japonicus TaxID=307972 RepID=A0A2G8KT61_STIJA|nr:hypothetical protein BSL78_11911 [Apostichopus japonicus]
MQRGFPEAVPLRNIDTERVAEALVDIFSRVGVPSEILTDRGSQFTSDVMKETNQSESASDVVVNDELGVGQSHEVKRVLSKFTDVLTDVPGKTDVLKCDIKLTTDKPIKAKPYPVPLSMRDSLQEEVRKMIDMGVLNLQTHLIVHLWCWYLNLMVRRDSAWIIGSSIK